MPRTINKHGFVGIRKRTTPQHYRKPYYARIRNECGDFIYSRNFAKAEEAAAEYKRMKSSRNAGKAA